MKEGIIFFNVNSAVPTAFPYNATSYANPSIVIPLASISVIAFIANAILASYIFIHKLYQNFISSHFISHLCLTNMIGLGVLMPMFMLNLWKGTNLWKNNNAMCRIQVFFFLLIKLISIKY